MTLPGKPWAWYAAGFAVIAALFGAGFFLGSSRKPGAVQPTATPAVTPAPSPESDLTPTPEESPIVTETPATTKKPTPKPSQTPLPTALPTAVPTSTPSPTPIVFGVTVTAVETVPPSSAQGCTGSPHTFTFKANINANTGGSATYVWERSDGATATPQSLTFGSAGTQTVTTTWQLSRTSGDSYSGWQRVKVTAPNALTSDQASFTVSCP